MTLATQLDSMEDLCIKYVPSRCLGDFLPAEITRGVIKTYAIYLFRLTDEEAYGHLRHLGVFKRSATKFVEERNKLKGGKK